MESDHFPLRIEVRGTAAAGHPLPVDHDDDFYSWAELFGDVSDLYYELR